MQQVAKRSKGLGGIPSKWPATPPSPNAWLAIFPAPTPPLPPDVPAWLASPVQSADASAARHSDPLSPRAMRNALRAAPPLDTFILIEGPLRRVLSSALLRVVAFDLPQVGLMVLFWLLNDGRFGTRQLAAATARLGLIMITWTVTVTRWRLWVGLVRTGGSPEPEPRGKPDKALAEPQGMDGHVFADVARWIQLRQASSDAKDSESVRAVPGPGALLEHRDGDDLCPCARRSCAGALPSLTGISVVVHLILVTVLRADHFPRLDASDHARHRDVVAHLVGRFVRLVRGLRLCPPPAQHFDRAGCVSERLGRDAGISRAAQGRGSLSGRPPGAAVPRGGRRLRRRGPGPHPPGSRAVHRPPRRPPGRLARRRRGLRRRPRHYAHRPHGRMHRLRRQRRGRVAHPRRLRRLAGRKPVHPRGRRRRRGRQEPPAGPRRGAVPLRRRLAVPPRRARAGLPHEAARRHPRAQGSPPLLRGAGSVPREDLWRAGVVRVREGWVGNRVHGAGGVVDGAAGHGGGGHRRRRVPRMTLPSFTTAEARPRRQEFTEVVERE